MRSSGPRVVQWFVWRTAGTGSCAVTGRTALSSEHSCILCICIATEPDTTIDIGRQLQERTTMTEYAEYASAASVPTTAMLRAAYSCCERLDI